MTLKLQDLIPVKEGGKLFGNAAKRVSTSELGLVFKELQSLLSKDFLKMQLTRFLPTKEDHGDIDILVLGSSGTNPKEVLHHWLGPSMVQYSKNGHTYSVLFRSQFIGKDVHVDFIYVTNPDDMQSLADYYSYNDFSGVVGIMARHLHFKYGSEGFFKRFRDKKGNWHDILITKNLMKGLEALGYSNAKQRFDNIKAIDDIMEFILSSPLLDSSYFSQSEMNQSDRKSVKLRRVIDYVVDKIRHANQRATVTDEDFFFRKLMPKEYEKVEKEKEKINAETYLKSTYNGQWLIDNFGLKPGPKIGEILKQITQKFGDRLDDTSEDDVKKFVMTLLP